MNYLSLTLLAKERIGQVVSPGDRVIDATLGNGHDCLFLAERVGTQGRVFAFEIMELAIDNALQRLEQAGLRQQVEIFDCGHEAMEQRVPPHLKGTIKAVMFNLGYLPGGDKQCITRPETTLQALTASARLLAPGGAISLIAYPGHAGGLQEMEQVDGWFRQLPPKKWQWEQIHSTGAPSSPVLYWLQQPTC